VVRDSTARAPGYDAVAKSLHWLVVALLVIQYILGWTLPHIGKDTLPVGIIFWHVSVGMLILAVVVVRLGWRIAHRVAPAAGLAPWEHWTASATHALLYIGLFVQVALGWANASARAWKIDLFAAVPMPWIVPAASPIGMASANLHDDFAIVLLVLIGLHVAAALYHYFIRRDRVLQRMLPGTEA